MRFQYLTVSGIPAVRYVPNISRYDTWYSLTVARACRVAGSCPSERHVNSSTEELTEVFGDYIVNGLGYFNHILVTLLTI